MRIKTVLKPTLAVGSMLLASQAGAVNLATDGIGEVAISPYYTVRDGWQTLINLTNVTDVPVVVKVRLHEAWNSRDVLDWNVALSAFDVWTASIQEAADGSGPVLNVTDDDTCTIPQAIDLLPLSVLGYSGLDDNGQSNDDQGPQDIDRLREGYIEFVVMGHADRGSYDVNDATISTAARLQMVGAAIESHDCDIVELAFDNPNIDVTARQFGEPINALKFNYRLLNPGRGVEAGGAAATWANFYNPLQGPDWQVMPFHNGNQASLLANGCAINRGDERDGLEWIPNDLWTGAGINGSCANLITAQTPFGFLEPSLNDAFPPRGNWFDDFFSGLVSIVPSDLAPNRVTIGNPTIRGIDAVSLTIQRSAVINEWSDNAALGVATDWIVTFPTKSFYVDQGLARQFGIIPGDRDEAEYNVGGRIAVPYPPFAEPFDAPLDGSNNPIRDLAESCNQVSLERFDRAENTLGDAGGVIPSPAPALPTVDLCYEANVLTFNNGDALGAANVKNVDTTALGATAGWMRLELDTSDSARSLNANPNNMQYVAGGNAPAIPGGLGGWDGLPTIGFLVKQRTFGDVTKNFASSMDHGYERFCTDNGTPTNCGVDFIPPPVFP